VKKNNESTEKNTKDISRQNEKTAEKDKESIDIYSN
jgi:hypothetical protein